MKNLSNENVIHVTKGEVNFLQFRKFLQFPEIRHAYSIGLNTNFRTVKKDENQISEEYNMAIKSYQSLCKEIGSNIINIVKPNQEHTDCAKFLADKINKNEPDFNLSKYNKTDGLITDKKNIILSTTNADCILLLFYDPTKRIIANTHSGWKGTLQRISVKTVDKMIKEYGCRAEDIICCICPSIRKCHFEVECDVKDLFKDEFQDIEFTDDIIEEKIPNSKWNIDTVLINKILLERKGLKKENIIDSGICSVCNCDLIHSYRVEKQGYGLNTALIELV